MKIKRQIAKRLVKDCWVAFTGPARVDLLCNYCHHPEPDHYPGCPIIAVKDSLARKGRKESDG